LRINVSNAETSFSINVLMQMSIVAAWQMHVYIRLSDP
jgi:hypothetical protein